MYKAAGKIFIYILKTKYICNFTAFIHTEQMDSCRYLLLVTCNFRQFPVKLVKFPSAKSEYISKKYL